MSGSKVDYRFYNDLVKLFAIAKPSHSHESWSSLGAEDQQEAVLAELVSSGVDIILPITSSMLDAEALEADIQAISNSEPESLPSARSEDRPF